jgi:hypothetical protein
MDVSRAYRGRIGTYQIYQDTSIHQVEYRVRTAHESHPHPYRIRIQYMVQDVLEESG